jgi:hypothetical protein
VVTEFSATQLVGVVKIGYMRVSRDTNLGRMRCVAVKIAPRRIQTPPTAMYAIPKKLLRPPMTVRVVKSTDLVPLYSIVGKSAK